MLQLRPVQMEILGRVTLKSGLLAHAHAVAPDVCAAVTSDELEAVVTYCMDRCAYYGIARPYDAARYLNLMLVFGPAFDEREDWAVEALAEPNPPGRMELLMDRALIQAAVPEEADA